MAGRKNLTVAADCWTGRAMTLRPGSWRAAPRLTPMVQDVKLVSDGHTGPREIAHGTDDLPVLHVAAGIIVGANHQDSGMLPRRGLYEQVQVFEIIVVFGEQHQALLDGVHEVARVRR